jgi:type IV secretion system protein VirB10
MPVKEIGDPRLQALFGANDPRDGGVRPTVRLPRKGLPPIAIGAVGLVLAVLLFSVLNARRTREVEPSVSARAADGQAGTWTAPPPLYIPPIPQPVETLPIPEEKPAPLPAPATAPVPRTIAAPAPVPIMQALPAPAPASQLPQRTSSGAPLVIDTGGAQSGGTSSQPVAGGSAEGEASGTVARMRASAFANRSMTVPQGYLIPAVLETGFDSTKPGYARAIVSRDVRGFDGKNVLIPRGSRLVGAYRSVVAQGQNRAIIGWTRLIRPDGMTIALDSPAVDPVGRGGVPAAVNSHFLARLGNALLQTTVGIGQALAGRAVTGPVVVLQGSAPATAAQAVAPVTDYTPTLTVRPGKSISIFVAQDLDFSAAGAGR